MALFFNREEYRRKPGTRSNTKFRVSSGDSPATQFVVDINLPVLFEYPYGGPGQKDIVISKGMVVGVLPEPQIDWETQKKRTALTIARPGIPVVGVAPYNISRRVPDQLTGNMPAIWTRDYVEYPLIRNADDAALIKYGAVYGDIKPGDLLVPSDDPNNYGKLMKFDVSKHSFADVVGQVLEVEIDQTPFGWLEWVMWDEQAAREDADTGLAKKQFGLPGEDGYGYDSTGKFFDRDTYISGKYATPPGYWSPYMTNGGQGIPGLTDGGQRSLTVWTKTFTAPAAAGNYVITLDYKNIIEGSVEITVDGNPIDLSNVVIDYKKGVVTVPLPDGAGDRTVVIKYRAYFFGTPPAWDYIGSVGAVRVLLKR